MNKPSPDYVRFSLKPCYRCGRQGATPHAAAGVPLCDDCRPPAPVVEPEPDTQRSPNAKPLLESPDTRGDGLPDDDTDQWISELELGHLGKIHPFLNLTKCMRALNYSKAMDWISYEDYIAGHRTIEELLKHAPHPPRAP